MGDNELVKHLQHLKSDWDVSTQCANVKAVAFRPITFSSSVSHKEGEDVQFSRTLRWWSQTADALPLNMAIKKNCAFTTEVHVLNIFVLLSTRIYLVSVLHLKSNLKFIKMLQKHYCSEAKFKGHLALDYRWVRDRYFCVWFYFSSISVFVIYGLPLWKMRYEMNSHGIFFHTNCTKQSCVVVGQVETVIRHTQLSHFVFPDGKLDLRSEEIH